MTDYVNHPPHYTGHPSGVEVIDITRGMSFDVGNAVKYIMRHEHKKNPEQDLRKALWYINDAINTGEYVAIRQDSAEELDKVLTYERMYQSTLPDVLLDVLTRIRSGQLNGAGNVLAAYIGSQF